MRANRWIALLLVPACLVAGSCASSTRKQQAINALNAVELATAVAFQFETTAYANGDIPVSAAVQADIVRAFDVAGMAEEAALTAVQNWDTGDAPHAAIQAVSDAIAGLQAILVKVGASQAVQQAVQLVNVIVRAVLNVYAALHQAVPTTAVKLMAVRH